MIRQLIKAINCNFIQKDVRSMLMVPSYYVRTRSPFNFYSFEEEIHKLKLLQEQQKSKQHNYRKGVSPLVKQSIEDLNNLYRGHNMLNFEVDYNFQSKKNNTQFRQKVKNREDLQSFQHLKIQNAIKIAYKILDSQNKTKENQLNSYEQAMVLEVFFYNILLSFLCEQPEIFQKILNKQENGPLIDEIYVIKSFMSYFFSLPNCIDIVSESPQLFKFIVKTAEILQINQEVVIPFIQQFLNKTSQEGIFYKSLYDITMIFLPISDYMAESRFNLLKIGQLDNSKALDIGNISLIIRQLLNIKESNHSDNNKRNVSREEIGILCKLFFCLVRVNQGRGKVCLDLSEAILTSNFEYLTEIEMTSIIYSIIKLEYNKNTEIAFERKIKREMPNLIFDYETKIEKMLQTGYFNHARIPYILYCLQKTSKFRPQYRKNQVLHICQNLIQIVMKNYEKYQAQEIVTIIYSLKVISTSFQKEIEDLYRAYFLKLAIEQQKREVNQRQSQDHIKSSDDDEEEQSKNQEKQKQLKKNTKEEAKSKSDNDIALDQKDEEQDDAQFLNNYLNQEYLAQDVQDVQISKPVKDTSQDLKIQNNNQLKKEKQNTQLANTTKQSKIQGYNIKMQKMRNTFQYFQQLQGLDILCLFIGIRNFNKNQNKHTKEKLNSIFIINQQLFKLFLSKLNYINDHLKIKILYEVSYNHPELLDSYLFEKNFQDWVVQIQDNLHKLNNFDFIALGFIMKKYARLFAYHIEFWMKYADESSKRKFQGTLESQRIKVVHQNMSDFYQKCLNSSSANQRQEVMRVNKVRTAYEKINYFLENQENIEYDGEQSIQNEDLDIDSFEQYR